MTMDHIGPQGAPNRSRRAPQAPLPALSYAPALRASRARGASQGLRALRAPVVALVAAVLAAPALSAQQAVDSLTTPDSLAATADTTDVAAASVPLVNQLDPSPPDTVAAEFRQAFGSRSWLELAERLHPDALARVRFAVDLLVQQDSTGWARTTLGGGTATDSAFAELPDDAVFVTTMRGLEVEVPGLISSFSGRQSELVGLVQENAITAHAVYRNQATLPGAEPIVLVMSLMRTRFGWKVRDVGEIDVLETALRGLPIPEPAPAPSGAEPGPVPVPDLSPPSG